jgi:hypothetical protein
MSTTSVTTTNIPKLTHHPSTYAGWRTAIEVALQLADSWNAGLDAEPGEVDQPSAWGDGDGTSKEYSSRSGDAGGVQDDLGECHDGRGEEGMEEVADEGE